MINLSDFDLPKFLSGDPLELKSKDLKNFEKAVVDIARQRLIVCLIAGPGCGIESFLEKHKRENEEEVFILNCRDQKIENLFADLMMDLQFGHRLVNWYDTPILNIVEALIYYLKEINNRTLLVFNNCDYLKLPVLSSLFFEFSRFKGNAGIIFRITPSYGEKILKSPDISLRSFMAQIGRFEVDYPTEGELISACQENGIVSRSVAEGIVKDTFDFSVIIWRVDTLRQDVNEFLKNGRGKWN